MAVVVQKSAGNLSSLISGNEFYSTVAAAKICPTNNAYETIGGSGSPTYINFTPTAAQDFKGVILGLYNTYADGSTARSRVITVELEENSGGWTNRLTQTIDTDDVIPDNTYSRGHGLIDVRFSSTYTLTAAAATWRLKIYHDGTGSGNFFLLRSENSGDDNIFHIVYSDTTASLTSSDVLVLTDKITVDQNLTLEKVDADSGSQNGMSTRSRYYSIYGCYPDTNNGTTPQIYVPSAASGDYTLTLKGIFFVSSYSTGLLVGEDADNPLPTARTFTVDFNDVSSANQAGFKAGTITSSYGKLAGIELWGTIPTTKWATLNDDVGASQADVKVDSDVTSDWAVGDKIEVSGAQYTSGQMYRDYCYNEYMEIQSMSFAAGVTTATCTGNFSYNHYIQSGMNVYVCNTTRNIVVKGTDGTYTQESYTNLHGGYMKCQGVRFEDIYYNYISYNYSAQYSPSQLTLGQSSFSGCHFHDCTYPFYLAHDQMASEMDGCAYSGSATGTTLTSYGVYITGNTRDTVINANIFQSRMVAAIYTSGGYGITVTSNYFNAQYGLWITNFTSGFTVNSNEFLRCRCGYFLSNAGNIDADSNTLRKCYYNGNASAGTQTAQGAICFNSANGLFYSEDDDVDDCFAFVVGQSDSGIVLVIKNPTLGSTWIDDVVNEAGATYRSSWLPETQVKFEDYDETVGDCRAWFTDGYILSTGTGLADTESRTSGAGMKAWRFEPFWANKPIELEMATVVGMANEQITVSVYCKINSDNYDAGVNVAPTMTISGLGMGTITDTADVTDHGTWQLLSCSGTPTSAGQITIKLSSETNASGSDSYVYWDDMYVSYKTSLDLGSLDNTFHGLPISPPLATQITAQNVWAELLADNRVAGSMGEAIHDIKWRSR